MSSKDRLVATLGILLSESPGRLPCESVRNLSHEQGVVGYVRYLLLGSPFCDELAEHLLSWYAIIAEEVIEHLDGGRCVGLCTGACLGEALRSTVPLRSLCKPILAAVLRVSP